MPTTPTLLGVPFDGASSFQRGAALAPAAIRAALHSESSNGTDEADRDIVPLVVDAGDVALDEGEPVEVIEAAAAAILGPGVRPIFLGGDHSVSWPLLRALRRQSARLSILHFDAHPDLYDEFEGSRTSHACPFARVMEEGLCDRLVQIGIRTQTRHQSEQATRFGVHQVPMRAGLPAMRDAVRSLEGSVYVSFDLDVLDPAFVPGISHPEPGGLSTREALELIQLIPAELIGADVVELNPVNDLRDLTARVAAKLVKELAGKMVKGEEVRNKK